MIPRLPLRRVRSHAWIGAFVLPALAVAALPSAGIIRRHDRDDERYLTLARDVKGVVDRIESVGVDAAIPAGAEIVDATRGFIVPGFIDNHVHVGRTGVSDDWVKNGVTTLVDNGSSAPTPGVPSCGRILTAPGGYPAFGSPDAPALSPLAVHE